MSKQPDTKMINSILAVLPFGLAVVNKEGIFQWVNDHFEQLFKLNTHDVSGKSCFELFSCVEKGTNYTDNQPVKCKHCALMQAIRKVNDSKTEIHKRGLVYQSRHTDSNEIAHLEFSIKQLNDSSGNLLIIVDKLS